MVVGRYPASPAPMPMPVRASDASIPRRASFRPLPEAVQPQEPIRYGRNLIDWADGGVDRNLAAFVPFSTIAEDAQDLFDQLALQD